MQTASGPAGISAWPTEGPGKDSWSCRHQHTRWSALCLARYALALAVYVLQVYFASVSAWDATAMNSLIVANINATAMVD